MARPTVVELIQRRNDALLANDAEAFAALFASDAAIEQPFAARGAPTRLQGLETIRAFAVRMFAGLRFDSIEEITIHRTDDPEVAIVEQVTNVTLPSSASSFSGKSISLFRVRDGAIILFRTYTGPPPSFDTNEKK